MGICLRLKNASRWARLAAARDILSENSPYRNVMVIHSPSDDETAILIPHENTNNSAQRPYYMHVPVAYSPFVTKEQYTQLESSFISSNIRHRDARKHLTTALVNKQSLQGIIDLHKFQQEHFDRFMRNLSRINQSKQTKPYESMDLATAQHLTGLLTFFLSDLSVKSFLKPIVAVPNRLPTAAFSLSLMELEPSRGGIRTWLKANDITFHMQKAAMPRSAIHFQENTDTRYPAFTLFDSTAGRENSNTVLILPNEFAKLAKAVQETYEFATPKHKSAQVLDLGNAAPDKHKPKQGRSVKPQHRIV